MEESNGQDSSVVQRMIAIVSNQRHNLGCYHPWTFETAKGSIERWCRRESNLYLWLKLPVLCH